MSSPGQKRGHWGRIMVVFDGHLKCARCRKKGFVNIYVHPLGGGHIIFAFSAVRRPTWFPDILGNSSYPIFTKFGMQVYWVNSLYGIAFGDDSSIAN